MTIKNNQSEDAHKSASIVIKSISLYGRNLCVWQSGLVTIEEMDNSQKKPHLHLLSIKTDKWWKKKKN